MCCWQRHGHGWRWVSDGQLPPIQAPQAWTVLAGPRDWQETEGVLAQWFVRHAAIAAIVRPDHYVYGVASDAAALVRQLAALRLD